MSFAAFMGGGDKEGSKGFMGRAVQINDENRVIDKQKDVLELSLIHISEPTRPY